MNIDVHSDNKVIINSGFEFGSSIQLILSESRMEG